jgi:predicted DNA binding CopG/RHH family protein
MWNPEKAKKTQFKTDREEACTASLNVRVPPSLLKKIKNRKNWQEFVRKTLEENVDDVPA